MESLSKVVLLWGWVIHGFLIALKEQSVENKRMHNKSVFVAAKKLKQKLKHLGLQNIIFGMLTSLM